MVHLMSRTLSLLLLLSLPWKSKGFIMCNCDSPECQKAGRTECRADLFCYVSFRPAQAEELKVSASTMLGHGAGSQLFIAQHRGCATTANHKLEACSEIARGSGGSVGTAGSGGGGGGGGGFRNLNDEAAGVPRGSAEEQKSVVRCCRENWCNTGQELSFTRAELDGRQFPLNPEISDLEPGLDFPMFQPGGHPTLPLQQRGAVPFTGVHDVQPHGVNPPNLRKRENAGNAKKRPTAYANDVPYNQWFGPPPTVSFQPPPHYNHEGAASSSAAAAAQNVIARSGGGGGGGGGSSPTPKKDDRSVAKKAQKESSAASSGGGEIHEDEEGANKRDKLAPVIVLQPLHIAIGVCLIILMLVAVLLHVVIVLHRRHRRLKRELLKQTQKPGAERGMDYAPNHVWPPMHSNSTSMSPQHHGQQFGMQPLQYMPALQIPPAVQASPTQEYARYTTKKSRSNWFWWPWKGQSEMAPPSNVYDEALPTTQASSDRGLQFPYCMAQETIQTPLTYIGATTTTTTTTTSLPSSAPTPPTLPSSPAQRLHPPLQPLYLPPSPEHQLNPPAPKNPGTYATGGSSVSGGSGNNCPSTAESSLPTSNCWNNSNSTGAAFRQNVLAPYLPNAHRPSLSGSSEAEDFGSPDFERRRANVALPPAILRAEAIQQPQMTAPPATTENAAIGIAVFRSAAPEKDACSLVTPYAQLQLSLNFDQYDTPEQVFGAGGGGSAVGSSSLDEGYHPPFQQTVSNPTTNSSLLHSYCEHAVSSGGEYRS